MKKKIKRKKKKKVWEKKKNIDHGYTSTHIHRLTVFDPLDLWDLLSYSTPTCPSFQLNSNIFQGRESSPRRLKMPPEGNPEG